MVVHFPSNNIFAAHFNSPVYTFKTLTFFDSITKAVSRYATVITTAYERRFNIKQLPTICLLGHKDGFILKLRHFKKPVYWSDMIGCIIIRRFAPWRGSVSPSQINENGLWATWWKTVLKRRWFQTSEFVFLIMGITKQHFHQALYGSTGNCGKSEEITWVMSVLCYEMRWEIKLSRKTH